jgi:transcriptional regulator GlxA family with amidase domain
VVDVRIGIFVFDDVEELDWVGPWEVFGVWARRWPRDGVEVLSVARDTAPVRSANGLRALPDTAWDAVGHLDVLVYPGGQGTRAQLEDEALFAWLRRRAHDGTLMTSVCTGALVYAAAGLLADRPATTHWRSLELLSQLDPSIGVRSEERFVDDGDVVTSAGVSAGIDMALHLVGRLHSPQRAAEVRRHIQYDPEPTV